MTSTMEEKLFFVLGVEGLKYGPASLTTLQDWMNEGRIDKTTEIESIDDGQITTALDLGINLKSINDVFDYVLSRARLCKRLGGQEIRVCSVILNDSQSEPLFYLSDTERERIYHRLRAIGYRVYSSWEHVHIKWDEKF